MPPNKNDGEGQRESHAQVGLREFKQPRRLLSNTVQPATGYGDLEIRRESSGLEKAGRYHFVPGEIIPTFLIHPVHLYPDPFFLSLFINTVQ